ncbi:MAG: PEP-CTERM sorting domain-containing protein [Methyloversatilis discipulorum]|uniref:PEP-CTERM sorting domain-containing protein n=1 Tax=Methyloversatilis discipulorum TaxID=1119528 RepID=UPI0026F08696|nr:PEP-CTERM sorting domain-containing protein [Methyloversatilis discipulorum]MBT9516054.1 PEP-CTERM sorting domain-containing protein [Methyloversatilis discipulorum]
MTSKHPVPFRIRASLAALLGTACLSGAAQAVPNDTFRSWSYVSLPGGGLLSDGQPWNGDTALWSGASSAWLDADSHARSQIGFENGQLAAKIEVSARSPVNGHVYSELFYRDQGFVCDADACGMAVPSAASFTVNLHQDGQFTAGSANFSVSYALWSAGAFHSFHFAVQQGEGPLAPYGAFSTENLVTGQSTLEPLMIAGPSDQPVFNPLFNLVWEDDDQDGVYNFAYDLSFTAATQGVDLREDLFMSAYVYGTPDGQFFDSFNSFHSTWTPEAGAALYGSGGRAVVGPVPEPDVWALMAAGLGMVAVLGRVRRREVD